MMAANSEVMSVELPSTPLQLNTALDCSANLDKDTQEQGVTMDRFSDGQRDNGLDSDNSSQSDPHPVIPADIPLPPSPITREVNVLEADLPKLARLSRLVAGVSDTAKADQKVVISQPVDKELASSSSDIINSDDRPAITKSIKDLEMEAQLEALYPESDECLDWAEIVMQEEAKQGEMKPPPLFPKRSFGEDGKDSLKGLDSFVVKANARLQDKRAAHTIKADVAQWPAEESQMTERQIKNLPAVASLIETLALCPPNDYRLEHCQMLKTIVRLAWAFDVHPCCFGVVKGDGQFLAGSPLNLQDVKAIHSSSPEGLSLWTVEVDCSNIDDAKSHKWVISPLHPIDGVPAQVQPFASVHDFFPDLWTTLSWRHLADQIIDDKYRSAATRLIDSVPMSRPLPTGPSIVGKKPAAGLKTPVPFDSAKAPLFVETSRSAPHIFAQGYTAAFVGARKPQPVAIPASKRKIWDFLVQASRRTGVSVEVVFGPPPASVTGPPGAAMPQRPRPATQMPKMAPMKHAPAGQSIPRGPRRMPNPPIKGRLTESQAANRGPSGVGPPMKPSVDQREDASDSSGDEQFFDATEFPSQSTHGLPIRPKYWGKKGKPGKAKRARQRGQGNSAAPVAASQRPERVPLPPSPPSEGPVFMTAEQRELMLSWLSLSGASREEPVTEGQDDSPPAVSSDGPVEVPREPQAERLPPKAPAADYQFRSNRVKRHNLKMSKAGSAGPLVKVRAVRDSDDIPTARAEEHHEPVFSQAWDEMHSPLEDELQRLPLIPYGDFDPDQYQPQDPASDPRHGSSLDYGGKEASSSMGSPVSSMADRSSLSTTSTMDTAASSVHRNSFDPATLHQPDDFMSFLTHGRAGGGKYSKAATVVQGLPRGITRDAATMTRIDDDDAGLIGEDYDVGDYDFDGDGS